MLLTEKNRQKKKEYSQPLITVLMPVYNSPDLFQALDSVHKQRYRPLQLILVDDASAIFNEEAIRDLFSDSGKDFSLCLLQNEENLGTVRTMNRGLALAKGKYVFNLAGDDAFYDESVLSDWVAAFEEADCDALTARRANSDKNLTEITSYSPEEKTIYALSNFSRDALFEYFAKGCPISGACTAWRRESLCSLNLYDEGYRLIEDYPAYLKLLRKGGRIGFFDRTVIRYRNGGTSEEGSSVSHEYEQDLERVYREEILPYVKNPAAARRRMARTKHSFRFDRWYNRQLEKSGSSRCRLFLFHSLYDVYHPMRTVRKIMRNVRDRNDRYDSNPPQN